MWLVILSGLGGVFIGSVIGWLIARWVFENVMH